MRLALAQYRATALGPADNLARGLELAELAAGQGAELLVFPELWQIGYAACPAGGEEMDRWLSHAIGSGDSWLGAFAEQAARLELAMVVTYLHKHQAGVANAAAVIGADGMVKNVHYKVHLCDFTWESVLTPGAAFRACSVPLRSDVVRLGVMTCFDREFPESARTLAIDGAELIVCPNACLLCDDRIGQLRARAFENMAAVALANYPAPMMNGRSCVFDGIATAGGRPRDHSLVVADYRAGLISAEIDLAALRAYRSEGIWSLDRRRPAAYRGLADPVRSGGSGR